MKKNALQKKWKKISNESGWVDAGPESTKRALELQAKLRSEKSAKDAKFTARLSTADFDALRAAAENEGMGYQTLLGSIVHKYVTGRLVDIAEVKKVINLDKRKSS